MEALPIVGRNWMGLGLMVKGVTANDTAGNTAGGVRRETHYQLNLDGQQIKQNFAGASSFSQPVISREAIAEYQVDLQLPLTDAVVGADQPLLQIADRAIRQRHHRGDALPQGVQIGGIPATCLTPAAWMAGKLFRPSV